jgi:hypothetical protein
MPRLNYCRNATPRFERIFNQNNINDYSYDIVPGFEIKKYPFYKNEFNIFNE